MSVTTILTGLLRLPRVHISNIAPFTHRDSLTYLERLEQLTEHYNTMVVAVQTMADEVNDLTSQLEGIIEKLDKTTARRFTEQGRQIDFKLRSMRLELEKYVDAATVGGRAFNPTNGMVEPIDRVIGDVFDWSREFAYFADDDMGTARDYDGAGRTARDVDTTPDQTIRTK